jgi:hypothetical protein
MATKTISRVSFYIALSTIFPLVRLSVCQDYRTYFWTFWITEAIYALAALLALHEAFRKAFVSFYRMKWFRLVFPAVAALMAFIAIHNAMGRPALQGPGYVEVILALATGVNYLEAVLFGLFFFLVLLLGVYWRSYTFGIVVGFGMSALGAMIAFGLRSEIGQKYDVLAKYLPPVAFLVGALIWLHTFRRPPDREPVWSQKMTATTDAGRGNKLPPGVEEVHWPEWFLNPYAPWAFRWPSCCLQRQSWRTGASTVFSVRRTR